MATNVVDHLHRLQGFRGTISSTLDLVSINTNPQKQRLSRGFCFPEYSIVVRVLRFAFLKSKLFFPPSVKQLGHLRIVQGRPKLEVLQLSKTPRPTLANATAVHGITTLTSHPLRLSKLRTHFLGNISVGPTTNAITTFFAHQ